MMDAAVDIRIFVVGVPRSGTTLVQSLLASHEAVTSFTESHFFSRHFRLLPGLAAPVLVADPTLRLREFLVENRIEGADRNAILREGVMRIPRARVLLPLRTRSVARWLLEVLDRSALSRGATGWIEKTAQHLRYIPFLESLSSAASTRPTQFVHVIRDGLDVVASLYLASRSWEPRRYPFALGPVPPYDLETCAKRWNRDLAFSLNRVASTNDHFVFYEDLAADPEATLRRLLSGLDLGWEPTILETYADTARGLIATYETWKDVDRVVRRSRTSCRALTADQEDLVIRSLHRDLYVQLHEATGVGSAT